jgi:putative FmdB family regulatory protein
MVNYLFLRSLIREQDVPLYEYQCRKCGQRTERIEKFNGSHLQKCPKCGGRVEQLLSAPAIQFKGSGWYVTDYARSSSAGTSGKDSRAAGKAEATSNGKPSGDSVAKPASPSSDKKASTKGK